MIKTLIAAAALAVGLVAAPAPAGHANPTCDPGAVAGRNAMKAQGVPDSQLCTPATDHCTYHELFGSCMPCDQAVKASEADPLSPMPPCDDTVYTDRETGKVLKK